MRTAIVAGFFDPVRNAVAGRFPKQVEVSSIVWVPQRGNGREPDLGKLNSVLNQQLKNGATNVLVLVAIIAGKDWVRQVVQGMVAEVRSRYGEAEILVDFETKVSRSNQDSILARIAEFNIPPPEPTPEPCEITLEVMRARLAGRKVLCVVLDGRTSFDEALERAGFPENCICDEFFEHMVVPGGRNSNLMETLHKRAEHHQHLLYAFTGLRTLSPRIKKRYSIFAYEGPNTREVVNLFKRWLLNH